MEGVSSARKEADAEKEKGYAHGFPSNSVFLKFFHPSFI